MVMKFPNDLQNNSILSGISLKMQLKMLWIDLQLNKFHLALIPCDNFDPKEDIGSLYKLTNLIWCKTNKKPLNEKQFTHAM